MQMIGKLRLLGVALVVVAYSCSGERATVVSANASAIHAQHRASAKAAFVKKVGARLVADSLFPIYRAVSTTYTIDVQRRLLSDTTPIVLESSLQDVAQGDSGITAFFGPRFSLGSLYLRLDVPPYLVKELLAIPREIFGSELIIAVRAKRISRPLFQFNTGDRASNSLPPALEAQVGKAFVLEGTLLGLSRIPQ